ncbi:5,6-dimethylbenzimidazole synthase [Rhodobacteraceae bacterium KMM 6894]|nr:5,6-dimethylbenzimidazole synthase [Rhodobacteraceae bacterium KMM 6894]
MAQFPPGFQDALRDLMRWRRDVRRFRTELVDEALLTHCLNTFMLSPSVGLSEPWRVMRLTSAAARSAALQNFEAANADALAGYDGEKAQIYSRIKLSGMQVAPVQLAVFCDEGTTKGSGLGAATMTETRRYSVVCAITQFWLAARAEGLGVGWVSILDPAQMARDLNAPQDWRLVAYLCVGWPENDSLTPELETVGWETRSPILPVEDR